MLDFVGSKMGKFTRIEVSDCDTTKDECILKRNSDVSITIDFVLSELHRGILSSQIVNIYKQFSN